MRLRVWNDVVDLLRQRYSVKISDDSVVELAVGAYPVRCRHLELDDGAWLEVLVMTLRTVDVAPLVATLLNVEFTVGSLCTYRGRACLRQTLPLVDMAAISLVETIETLVGLVPLVTDSIRRAPLVNPGLMYAVD